LSGTRGTTVTVDAMGHEIIDGHVLIDGRFQPPTFPIRKVWR
jgi:hypothetical protein